jgi:uncharacterized protein (DUF2235 family)
MKRLVICCDGTWNSADQENSGKPCPTNVVKLAVRIARRDAQGTPQIVYYDQGVGTGNFLDHIGGGAFGDGLEANIHDAYRFLVANYEVGDEIYLFGFSRGAFTARSIAGMVRKCGILSRPAVGRYLEAENLYRSELRPDHADCVKFRKESSLVPDDFIKIKFIGVWDTVGALGMPVKGLHAMQARQYEFHDTELSGSVENAYHALAIDELRGPFRPTLWDYKPKPDQRVEQTWFCGVHSDVGGGYGEMNLSDIPLQWMMDKANATGLALDAEAIKALPLNPMPDGTMHNSMTMMYHLVRNYVRPICVPSEGSKNAGPDGLDPTQRVHESVEARWKADKTYRPQNLRDYFKRTGNALAND